MRKVKIGATSSVFQILPQRSVSGNAFFYNSSGSMLKPKIWLMQIILFL